MRHFKFIFLLLLMSNQGMAVTDSFQLLAIASNTLGSLTALEELVTDQAKYMDKFNEIHAEVEEKVWRADRILRWAEDIKNASGREINDLDDLNSVLARIKNKSRNIKKALLKADREVRQSEANIDHHKKEKRLATNKLVKMSAEGKPDYNTTTANIETAKNTQDIKFEMALISKKLSELNESLSKVVHDMKEEREIEKSKQLEVNLRQSKINEGLLQDVSL